MAIDVDQLRIVHYPDPILRTKAKPIEAVTDEVRQVAARMLQLMHEAPGVGLAGPQVGLGWRIFVTCTTGEAADDLVFINPTLSEPSPELSDYDEGCLSLPHVTASVRRPKGISIEATDLEGNRFKLSSDELPARVWQHEYDHLDGVLILDRMAPIDKKSARKHLREMEEAYEEQRLRRRRQMRRG